MNKKVILAIMDGWGIAPPDKFNAIDNALTPTLDTLTKNYPYMELKAHGEFVGLPEGQMGTSEVNHLAIGTGRILLHELPRINKAIIEGAFSSNQELLQITSHVQNNRSKLHLIGIVSEGGIHSHLSHLFAILDLLKNINFTQPVYLHLFTDGRDSPPKSASEYLAKVQAKLDEIGIGKIATVQGRMYLDRDRDWAKTETAFQLIRNGQGKNVTNWQDALNDAYTLTDNDQYLSQYRIEDDAKLTEGDGMLFFHFRTDRLYQIIKRTLDENIPNLYLTAFVKPSEEFKFNSIFTKEKVENCLAKVISDAGKSQLHITETEKYTHLTYFFNGEREIELPSEKWTLLESNRFVKPQYNFEPSMQAFGTTKQILDTVSENTTDFIVVNYANTDMVGHTGNYNAAVIAAESVDYCIGKLYEVVKDRLDEYVLIVTADHGNTDEMWDYKNNQPHTQHTLNPVPFVVVTNENIQLAGDPLLSNIAPTILKLMGLTTPTDMEGKAFF